MTQPRPGVLSSLVGQPMQGAWVLNVADHGEGPMSERSKSGTSKSSPVRNPFRFQQEPGSSVCVRCGSDTLLLEATVASRSRLQKTLPCSSIMTGGIERNGIDSWHRAWRRSPVRVSAFFSTRSVRSRVAVAEETPVIVT